MQAPPHSPQSRIGRDRMVWRYDPVILNSRISMEYHRRKFDMMCREASRWTDRCVFSFVDIYGKLFRLKEEGVIRRASPAEMDAFAEMASRTAEEYGITLSCCCNARDFTRFGIEPRGCVDREMMRTWPASNPMADLDHILTSRGQVWEVKEAQVLEDSEDFVWSNVTDHLPVVATLKLIEQ